MLDDNNLEYVPSSLKPIWLKGPVLIRLLGTLCSNMLCATHFVTILWCLHSAAKQEGYMSMGIQWTSKKSFDQKMVSPCFTLMRASCKEKNRIRRPTTATSAASELSNLPKLQKRQHASGLNSTHRCLRHDLGWRHESLALFAKNSWDRLT